MSAGPLFRSLIGVTKALSTKTQDPLNPDGHMPVPRCHGYPDGRYYLYYVLDKVSVVSVAVCDEPAGQYEFYGYVRYPDGTRLGERPVTNRNLTQSSQKAIKHTCTLFCGIGDRSRWAAWQLFRPHMLTVVGSPSSFCLANLQQRYRLRGMNISKPFHPQN